MRGTLTDESIPERWGSCNRGVKMVVEMRKETVGCWVYIRCVHQEELVSEEDEYLAMGAANFATNRVPT